MNLQERNFIALLGEGIGSAGPVPLEDPSYPEILMLADKHAVTSLLYPGLKKHLPMGDPMLTGLKKKTFAAATRESIQSKELSQIFAGCQEAQIPILPLKGCVIKSLYPYPELRFMSDADLLIRDEDGAKMRHLMEALGHTFHKVDAGDTDVYVSPLSMNYEIHRGLEGEGFSPEVRSFTAGLLDLSRPVSPGSYHMELPPEEHYVYILCHFIKHFIYGGVGVRQLTDLYICYNGWEMDPLKLDRLLQEVSLTDFHRTLQELWAHWFQGAPAGELTEELGTYILHSGVFGNEEQRATDRLLSVSQDRSYILARLFPPFKTMKAYFPILKKVPILLPFAWVWRGIRAVLFRREKLTTELNALSSTDESALENRRRFYNQCGLSVYDQ